MCLKHFLGLSTRSVSVTYQNRYEAYSIARQAMSEARKNRGGWSVSLATET